MMNLPPKTLEDISVKAAQIANMDERLPPPLYDNGVFNPSYLQTNLSIDYNQTDVAMAFIGYQERRKRSKKKMHELSLTDIYVLLDEIGFDSITQAVQSSMGDVMPHILDGIRNG